MSGYSAEGELATSTLEDNIPDNSPCSIWYSHGFGPPYVCCQGKMEYVSVHVMEAWLENQQVKMLWFTESLIGQGLTPVGLHAHMTV